MNQLAYPLSNCLRVTMDLQPYLEVRHHRPYKVWCVLIDRSKTGHSDAILRTLVNWSNAFRPAGEPAKEKHG